MSRFRFPLTFALLPCSFAIMPLVAQAEWYSHHTGGTAGTVDGIVFFDADGLAGGSGSTSFTKSNGLEVSANGGGSFTFSSGNVGATIESGSSLSVSGVPTGGSANTLFRAQAGNTFSWRAPQDWLEMDYPTRSQLMRGVRRLQPQASFLITGSVAPGDSVSFSGLVQINRAGFPSVIPFTLTDGLLVDEPGPFSFSAQDILYMTPFEMFGSDNLGGSIDIEVVASANIRKGAGGGTTTVSFNPPQLSVVDIPEPTTWTLTLAVLCLVVGRLK